MVFIRVIHPLQSTRPHPLACCLSKVRADTSPAFVPRRNCRRGSLICIVCSLGILSNRVPFKNRCVASGWFQASCLRRKKGVARRFSCSRDRGFFGSARLRFLCCHTCICKQQGTENCSNDEREFAHRCHSRKLRGIPNAVHI